MDFRRLFSFTKDFKNQHSSEPEGNKGSGDSFDQGEEGSALDILGQNSFRLIPPIHSKPGAHSEKYETALQVVEEFKTIFDQEERQKFWDDHYTVFGLASCLVFDTHTNEYHPHHSFTQDLPKEYYLGTEVFTATQIEKLLEHYFLGIAGKEEGRYIVVYIYPADTGGIRPFVHWCIPKYQFANFYTFIDQSKYWEEMGRRDASFSEEYLEECLAEAESHYKLANEKVKECWNDVLLTDEAAKRFCRYYGLKDRKENRMSRFNMFSIARNILTCPLPTYGEIFFQYYEGWRIMEMLSFLREQKKRMGRGENIRVPPEKLVDLQQITQTENGTDESLSKRPIGFDLGNKVLARDDAYNETPKPLKYVFIKEKQREIIVRQLGYGLDEPNKVQLKKLLALDLPDHKIHTNTDAKVLADYFRQVYCAGDIDNNDYTKDDVGEWLASWFVGKSGKAYQPQSFKYFLQMTDNNNKTTGLIGKIKYSKR